MKEIAYLALGLCAGGFSGLVGLGGGVVLVPALIYFFGLSQQTAQGTTLAIMVPPIGLLAAMAYYKHGAVNIGIAAFVCIGFFIGGLLGAKFALGLSNEILRKVFGFSLLGVSIHMIFFK
jgi:uncharacterized membrane protein YfcA